jgi:hypothetical protein
VERPAGSRIEHTHLEPEAARHCRRRRARGLEGRRDEQSRRRLAPLEPLELALEQVEAALLHERDAEEDLAGTIEG